jgi:hypothetical protein
MVVKEDITTVTSQSWRETSQRPPQGRGGRHHQGHLKVVQQVDARQYDVITVDDFNDTSSHSTHVDDKDVRAPTVTLS